MVKRFDVYGRYLPRGEKMNETTEEFPLESSPDECVYPVDPVAQESLGEGIKKLITKQTVPQFKELAENLLDEWGGPRQIAKAFHETYLAAPAGSMTRSRILDRIMSFVQLVSEDSTEPEFDDEVIIAVLREELSKDGYADPQTNPQIQLPGPIRAISQHSDDPGDNGS